MIYTEVVPQQYNIANISLRALKIEEYLPIGNLSQRENWIYPSTMMYKKSHGSREERGFL